MNRVKSRRFFTLVEVLIVIALIAVVAGVVGFNIVRMRQDQQFRSGAALVQQKLQAALETMLIHNENMEVILEEKPEGLLVIVKAETPLERGLGRFLNRNPIVKGIHSIGWITPEGRTYSGKAILEFSAISHTTSQGTLILSGYESLNETGPLRKALILQGFPHPIQGRKDQLFVEEKMDSELFYPRQVREMWEANAANH